MLMSAINAVSYGIWAALGETNCDVMGLDRAIIYWMQLRMQQ